MAHRLGPISAVVLALLASGSAQADHAPAHCLAMAIYWEAKACGRDDMAAVGHVVLNRLADPEFPDDVCAVVKEGGEQPPCQFSWWCDGKADQPDDDEAWRLAGETAAGLLAEPGADPTGGARFFHSAKIETPWAVERQRTAASDCHVFYR
jgi:spore germination cell wall hydrolase CwlJ-like protein